MSEQQRIDLRQGVINAIDNVAGLKGVAEIISNHILLDGIKNVTLESLTSLSVNIDGRVKEVSEASAKRVLAALDLYQAFKAIDDFNKESEPGKRKPRMNEVSRFLESTTEEQRHKMADDAAFLRIVFDGNKPLSWSKIREQLSLKSEQFHSVIRVSDRYKNAVKELLKKRYRDGWKYSKDLDSLAGFDLGVEFITEITRNVD